MSKKIVVTVSQGGRIFNEPDTGQQILVCQRSELGLQLSQLLGNPPIAYKRGVSVFGHCPADEEANGQKPIAEIIHEPSDTKEAWIEKVNGFLIRAEEMSMVTITFANHVGVLYIILGD